MVVVGPRARGPGTFHLEKLTFEYTYDGYLMVIDVCVSRRRNLSSISATIAEQKHNSTSSPITFPNRAHSVIPQSHTSDLTENHLRLRSSGLLGLLPPRLPSRRLLLRPPRLVDRTGAGDGLEAEVGAVTTFCCAGSY